MARCAVETWLEDGSGLVVCNIARSRLDEGISYLHSKSETGTAETIMVKLIVIAATLSKL